MFGYIPVSMRAKVLEMDGEVAAIAGYYLSGGVAVFFSDVKRKIPKMTVWREAVAFMEEVRLPAVCQAQDGSERFLERLGWVRDGEVFRWPS